MNRYLDGVLVVEGKSDAAVLSHIISSPIFVTNGFETKARLISLLKLIEKNSKVYLLMDDDESGKKICDLIAKSLQNPIILKINTTEYTSKKKHGIAEIKYQILNAYFKQITSCEDAFKIDFDETLIYKLNKEKIIQKYNLPFSSIKGILKCLKSLKISKEDLQEFYGN